GREAESRRVAELLAAGVPVVIDGMAGVGKSSLAVHAAWSAAKDYPDGQLFCDLHGFTPGREPLAPDDALAALLLQLGRPQHQLPAGLDRRAAMWRSQCAGRRLLVFLDNAAGVEQVLPLLPGAPGVGVVITSRRRLAGLDSAVPVSLDVLPADAAGRL